MIAPVKMLAQDDIVLKDLLSLHFAQFVVIGVARGWCAERGLPFKLTSIESDRGPDVNEVSTTHPEFRAIDISDEGWNKKNVFEFKVFMNRLFYSIAAIAQEGKIPTLIVHHDAGTGTHLHIQIRRDVTLKMLLALFK